MVLNTMYSMLCLIYSCICKQCIYKINSILYSKSDSPNTRVIPIPTNFFIKYFVKKFTFYIHLPNVKLKAQ